MHRRSFLKGLGILLAAAVLPMELVYKFQDPTGPIGTIHRWTRARIPKGWLPCDGRDLPKNEYPELAALVGTSYGKGDTATFKIPDLRSRFISENSINSIASGFILKGVE